MNISKGIINQSLAHPREIFKECVKYKAVAFIAGHNHPSGNLSPSENDRALTERLRDAGKLMGIPMLDHIIVSERGYYSFRESSNLLTD